MDKVSNSHIGKVGSKPEYRMRQRFNNRERRHSCRPVAGQCRRADKNVGAPDFRRLFKDENGFDGGQCVSLF
jgi:hypothetical protein